MRKTPKTHPDATGVEVCEARQADAMAMFLNTREAVSITAELPGKTEHPAQKATL